MIDGYEDMGLAEFRIAMVMGCLLGAVEAATRIAQAHGALDAEGTPTVSSELVDTVGSPSSTVT